MEFRKWVNQKGPWIKIAATCVLLLCVSDVWYQFNSDTTTNCPPAYGWFYDLQSNKLFPGPRMALPPIPIPSGQKDAQGNDQGVRAIVFSCGRCEDESSRYIGYLETLSPEAKEQIQAWMDGASMVTPQSPPPPPPTKPMGDPMMNGRLIARPNGPWLKMDSPDSSSLIQEAMSRCGEGKYPTQCLPTESDSGNSTSAQGVRR